MSIASEITRINNNISSAYSKISEKGGTLPETQNSANLATAIDSISGGGGYPDWSEIGYENAPPKFINTFNYSKEIYDNWDATVTSLNDKFRNNNNLIYMPLVNTSNVNTMNDMFNSCTKLTTIPLLDTSNVTRMERMFYNCYVLADIPVLDTSNVISGGMYAMFMNTQGTFSDTSFNNILRMCINATKMTSANKKLYSLGFNDSSFTV